LEASFFYSKYFEEIKNFVSNLPDDAVSIKECKKVLAKEDLHNQLQFIQTNFEKIPQCIKFLQGRNIKLSISFNKIEGLFEELKMIEAPITDKLKKKIDAVVSRNLDYHTLKQISMHTGFVDEPTYAKYQSLIPFFEFAPVTSCDVERSFSKFKDVLTPKHCNFSEDHLEKNIIIHAFYNYFKED
jgi:hypothetical protein